MVGRIPKIYRTKGETNAGKQRKTYFVEWLELERGAVRYSDESLCRRPGENEVDYHKRIIYGKLVDKTLSDFDYSELAEYIYGKPYSTDVARRMFYGSCKTLQLMDTAAEKNTSATDASKIVSELEKRKMELQKERQRYSDQRREIGKVIASLSRKENLEDRLYEAAMLLNENYPLLPQQAVANSGYVSGSEAVIVFADWHYGMVAKNIWNEYDTNICKQRVSKVVESAIERIRLHHCKKVHVLLLGDMAHGAIHTSARVASEELVCDQLMQVSEIIAQAVYAIDSVECVQETDVYSTYGNHMRTVPNKNDSIHRDNMERIIPWWLEQRLQRVPSIVVAEEDATEFLTLNVCGYNIVAAHGDLDGAKTSPRVFTALFQKSRGKSIDYIILADKHHKEEFEELGVESMVVRSLCGTDDYANSKRLYSTPGQLMMIFNEDCGADAIYHIKI